MVFVLLSPAKTMKFDDARPGLKKTTPYFAEQVTAIARTMKKFTPMQLGALMHISEKLAALNAGRYKDFGKQDIEAAILAFQGDTYIGFDAKTLSDAQLKAAQNHVGILSGLYGVLQPLDTIEPYRLEMGTSVSIAGTKDLYAYWDDAVTARINTLVKKNKAQAVIGCASHEYLRVVHFDRLAAPFIQCDFKENKNGKLATVGLFAKRARGMMARYVVEKNITDPKVLKTFTGGGYAFDKALSDDGNFVFVR